LQVELRLDKDSKEAKRAAEKQKAAAAAGGLDAFLTQIESKKKVSRLREGAACWRVQRALGCSMAACLDVTWLHVSCSESVLLWFALHETCIAATCLCELACMRVVPIAFEREPWFTGCIVSEDLTQIESKKKVGRLVGGATRLAAA
jgi:hypothetical protein